MIVSASRRSRCWSGTVAVLLAWSPGPAFAESLVKLDWQLRQETPAREVHILPDCRAGGDPDAIVVCGRRKRQSDRLEQEDKGFDFDGPVDSVWREKSRLLERGEVGIGSCSPVGPGGVTGCMAQSFRHYREQHAGH